MNVYFLAPVGNRQTNLMAHKSLYIHKEKGLYKEVLVLIG